MDGQISSAICKEFSCVFNFVRVLVYTLLFMFVFHIFLLPSRQRCKGCYIIRQWHDSNRQRWYFNQNCFSVSTFVKVVDINRVLFFQRLNLVSVVSACTYFIRAYRYFVSGVV